MPGSNCQPRRSVARREIRRRGLALLCGLLAGIACHARETAYQLSIPASTLPAALIELAQQTGVSLVFATARVPAITVNGMQGRLSTRQALQQMLEGSGLVATYIDERIVSIGPGCRTGTDCGAGAGTGAVALEEDAGYVDTRVIEQMIVRERMLTGSHMRQASYLGSAAVDIISAPEIEATGAQSLGDLLRVMPAVIGNQTSTAVSNGGDGTATVTLRGLPASNTLVLINGRRSANHGLTGEAFDLNSLSPAAVDRIEILKDGASAIYGSDAIAGVVNIILKRDFSGVQLSTQTGETQRGDRGTTTTNLLIGEQWQRASLVLSASIFEQDEVRSRDRSVSRSADGRPQGGADLRSSATPAARISIDDQVLTLRQQDGGYLPGSSAGDFRPVTGNDLYDFRAETTALVPSERNNFHLMGEFDLHQRLTAFMDLGYSHSESDSRLAPTPVFTAFESNPLTVSALNPFNPFGVDIADVRKRFVELGPRRQQNSTTNTRAALGLEGLVLGTMEWNASYNWSRSEAEETLQGLIDGDRLQLALGPGSACAAQPGCVPVNVFGAPGAVDSRQLDYLATQTALDGYTRLHGLEAGITGPVARTRAGEVLVAGGISSRKEATASRGSRNNPRFALGGSDISATSGDRRVEEAWGELLLPLFADGNGAHRLDLEFASRLSHYSDFGDTSNNKIALRYRPAPSVLLRGTLSEGFRAPSLQDLYESGQQSQAFLSDPCALKKNVGVLPGCALPGDPTRSQFLTVIGGNPELEAEQSDNMTLGMVWTPAAIAGLMLSADAFRIQQSNVVDASAQFILDENARTGGFAERVLRDAEGNLQRVNASNINIGERRVTGVDFSLRYRLPTLPFGRVELSLDSAYIHEYLNQLDPGAQRQDIVGQFADAASGGMGAIPEWKSRIGAQWNRGPWEASYRMQYVSDLREDIPNSRRQRSIDSWLVHDLQIGRRFALLEGLRVSLGIDNLLDTRPPFAASAFNDSHDGRTHDLRGRYWYAKLRQDF
jgi:iron complex outermembrane recepter protein